MDWIIFTIGSIGIAIILLLWIAWSNRFLQHEKTELDGKVTPKTKIGLELTTPILPGGVVTAPMLKEVRTFPKSDVELQALVTESITPSTKLTYFTKSIVPSTKQKSPNTNEIKKDVRVQYSRRIYLNRTFLLNVLIAPQGELPKLTPEKEKIMKETDINKLNFEAFEKTPEVKVELKFTEGDFSSSKTKEVQELKEKEVNKFSFLLKALKAEDCVITVVISYMKTIEVINKVTEKILIGKTILTPDNLLTKEVEQQTKLIPISASDEEVELKTIQLIISVKSFFGMNALELELLKKASAPIAYSLFLAVNLLTGQLEGNDAIISGFASLLPAFGITAIAEYWKKAETAS